jgi:glycosyltransferase involved in cell wall biosynthesis
MRILELTSHYSPNVGGVETHLTDLVTELLNHKNKVFVLTYIPLTTKAKYRMVELRPNLKVLRISWIPGLFYKLVDKPLLEFIYLLPGLFFVTPFVLITNNFDVIQAHGLVAGFVGGVWGKVFGKRVVVTTHSEYEFPEKGLYRNFAKWIFSNANCVLTLSNKSKLEVNKLGINEDKIKVFTYWIDLNKFKNIKDAQKKLGWSGFSVLFVGRLVEEKGIKVLINSAKSWNKNINLVIIGAGPLEDYCEKAAKNNENIKFLGKVGNELMPIYYSSVDIVIVPSIHEEGFGRVILESLACGTPVIAANRGGIKEAMDETVGSLININEKNIKKEVERYYKDQKLLQKKAKNSRKFAEKNYSNKNVELIVEQLGKI